MAFNSTGDTLASVASSPDYMLTLWTWTEEKILLHSKAFGQEIYTVRFSEYNPSSLTTSGTGHIRFWKMASTFTGRKLQGSIGKFGKVELSDISAFVELPDGKVVSGTESGAMLLWEGNFIKCRFICPGNNLCHDGEITSIEIDHIKGCIVTAGLDGLMKWWDLEVIDTAEVDSDHSMDFIIQPLSDFAVTSSSPCGIRSILYHHKTITPDTYDLLRNPDEATSGDTIRDMDTMYVLETNGDLKMVSSPSVSEYGIPQQDLNIKTLHSSHGSEITSLDCSPIGYIAVTGGLDGRLIFWDVRGRKEMASKQFSVAITSLSWIPIHIDPTGQSICVGFQDGICKVIRLNRDPQISNKDLPSYTIIQTMVMKPHNAPVTHISFSNSSQLLVTAGKDGILFFFHCKQKYINGQLSMYAPLRFIRLKKNSNVLLNNNQDQSSSSSSLALASSTSGTAIVDPAAAGATTTTTSAASTNPKSPLILCTSLAWSGSCLLMSCSDGIAREVDSEIILASTNEDAESYESDCQIREISLKIPLPPVQTTAVTGSSSGGGSAESKDNNRKEKESGGGSDDNNLSLTVPGKILKCVYSFAFDNTLHDKYYAAVMATFPSSGSSSSSSQTLFSLQESSFQSEIALKEYPFGAYDNSSKDLRRIPQITSMKYGISREFIAIGQSDGTISLLPVNHLTTYLTAPAHNNAISGGVSCVALSYDNKYLLSTGFDGLLVIYRLKPLEILEAAQRLMTDLEKGIFLTSKTKITPQILDSTTSSYCVTSTTNLINFPSLYETTQQAQHPEQVLEEIIKILPEIDEIPEFPNGGYSIEDAKLKQEEDIKKSTAEIKKDKIRIIINKLRKEFEELKYHNSQLPEVIQLTSNELLVDREYFDLLKIEEEKMMNEIHLECEYVMEKSMKLHEKMYKRLMGELLVEEMPLYGLRQKKPPKVYSLRTIGLSPEMNELLMKYSLEIKREEEILSKAKIDAILANDLENATNSNNSINGAGGAGGGGGPGGNRLLNRGESIQSVATNKSIDSLLHQSHGGGGGPSRSNTARGGGGLTTATGGGGKANGSGGKTHHHHGPSRRELRLERIHTIQSHLLKKPNENDDDERDISAINHAIKTIGNYSLKSSDTYEVPEDQIINAEKKKRQIMMLQEAMIVLRLQFNERFLLLRKLKIEIISNMKQFNLRLKQIHHELDIMNMVNAATASTAASTSATAATAGGNGNGGGKGSNLLTNNHSAGGGALKSPSPPANLSPPHRYSDEKIWQPELSSLEFPDDRDEVTTEEIQEYKQKRDKEKDWTKVIPPPHHIFTGTKTVIEGSESGSEQMPMKGKFLVSKSASSRNPFNRQAIRLTSEEMQGKVKFSSVENESISSSSSSGGGRGVGVGVPSDTVLCFYGIEKLNHLNHEKLESSIPVLAHIKHCTQHARHLTEKQIHATLQQLQSTSGHGSNPLHGIGFGVSSSSPSSSSDEKKLMNEYRHRLIYEKQSIENKITEYISTYDQNIEDLRHDRHVLISNLKLSELKLLTYLQEYFLLLTFEEKDNYLKNKYLKYKTEKNEINLQLFEIQNKLDGKLEDLNIVTEKNNLLFQQYLNLIPGGENNQFFEILTKIYRKKIKRIKNFDHDGGAGGGGGGGGDDDDEIEDSDDENDDDDDDYDDEDIEDICPHGCEVTLYDQIILLREKKLDLDEMNSDLLKNIEELKKSKERFKQREKQIDKDLKGSENEIQNFQRQKQSALNKIEVNIPLRMSQIHAFVTSGVLSGPPKEGVGAGGGGGGVGSNPNLNVTGESGAEMTTDTVSVGSESVGDGGGGGGTGGAGGHGGNHLHPMSHEEKLLLNANRRSLIAEMDMTSHTVFKTA
jgi:WD40 repeat protein